MVRSVCAWNPSNVADQVVIVAILLDAYRRTAVETPVTGTWNRR